MIRLLRQISLRQLRATWGRTILVVAGIAMGVSLIVAINIINRSALANLTSTIELIAGPAELEVTLGVGEVGFDESAMGVVRADPDVVAAVPLVRGTISLASDPGETLQLFGADLLAEEDLRRYQVRAVTERRQLVRVMEDPRSILVTTAFASRHKLFVGDKVELSTPDGVGRFTVRGLLETEGLAAALGGQLAVMDLAAVQILLRKEGRVDQIDVILRRGADIAAVRQRLEAALPSVLTVARPAQRGEHYEQIISSFQAMLAGLSTLCLLAGIFIVYNTTSTGAVRRAMTMASLRVVGADGGRLFRLLMTEAVILGLIGSLLGVAIGVGLANSLTHMVTDSMGTIFQLRFQVQRLAIGIPEQGLIVLLGILAAGFASYFPAKRVAWLEPLKVIREGFVFEKAEGGMRRLMAWGAILVGVSVAALVAEKWLHSIAFGNLGATLWNASAILFAVPLVSWSSTILSRLLPRLFAAEGRLATGSLLRSPTRTGVTVAAIALVLAVAITVTSLTQSFHQSTASYVNAFLASDLSVSAVATEGGWLETPVPEELAHEIGSLPGVRAVETVRALPGQIYRGQRISVLGLSDSFFEPGRYPSNWYKEGNVTLAAPVLRRGEGANISTGLADRFGLHVGDKIELDTPTGPLTLPIMGAVPDLISDRGTVILSRRLLAKRWRETAVSRIHVFVDPGVSIETIRGEIAKQFGSRYRLKVLSLREVLEYHTDKVNRAFAFTDAIQLLLVLVTVAGIFDLLLSSISERRRELALWRVIGAEERVLRRSVVIESGTIGGMGILLGIAVGLVTAWIWLGINFRYLLGYYLEYHVPAGTIIWYAILVMVMTLLSGYGASYWVTRQSVLDGIRRE